MINKQPEGLILFDAGLDTAVLTNRNMLTGFLSGVSRLEVNHQYWLDVTRDVHVATAQAFGVIVLR